MNIEVEKTLEEKQLQITTLNNRISILSSEEQRLKDEIIRLENKKKSVEDLEETISIKKSEIFSLNNSILDLQSKKDEISGEIEIIKSQRKEIERNNVIISSLGSRIISLSSEKDNLLSTIKSLEGQKLSIKSEHEIIVAGLDKEVERREAEVIKLGVQIDEVKIDISKLCSEKEKLLEEKNIIEKIIIEETNKRDEIIAELEKMKSLVVELNNAKNDTDSYVKTRREEIDSLVESKTKTLNDREGELSVKENSLKSKSEELIRFKSELEKVYGKPIKINLT